MRTYAERLDLLEEQVRELRKSRPLNKTTAVPAKPSNTVPFTTQLSTAQLERLSILAEECAEVIKCVTKIQRHGFESINPHEPEDGTNREQLESEIADIHAAVQLLMTARDVSDQNIARALTPAINRKLAFCHFQ